MSDTFDWEGYYARQEEQRTKKRKEIAEFKAEHQLKIEVLTHEGKRLLILQSEGLPPLPQEKAEEYLTQFMIGENNLFNNCFELAENACQAGIATGRIAADSGTSDFVGMGNHCINIDELPDGSIVAFDLTAANNIDNKKGLIDVLALRAVDLNTVLSWVNQLYGGKWKVI